MTTILLKCPHSFSTINNANNISISPTLSTVQNNYCSFNACPHLFYNFNCGNLTCPHNNIFR